MPLNKAKGNMFGFITHTWNAIRGLCWHDCIYCYMDPANNPNNDGSELHLEEKELSLGHGSGRFIFVGSSTDMFADVVPSEWIVRVLDHCNKFSNYYLFQTKNPERFLEFIDHPVILSKSVLSTTLETNRWYPKIMNNAPQPYDRANAMAAVAAHGVHTMVTVEPAMAFDHDELVAMIRACKPMQVNIGCNTIRSIQLPEPTLAEVQALITDLNTFTRVHIKPNASVLK